jgi:hypothetical protein
MNQQTAEQLKQEIEQHPHYRVHLRTYDPKLEPMEGGILLTANDWVVIVTDTRTNTEFGLRNRDEWQSVLSRQDTEGSPQ